MAEKDLETEKLELSLFRRKRKKDKKASTAEVDAPPTETAEPAGASETAAADAPTTDAPTTAAPTSAAPAAEPRAEPSTPQAAPTARTAPTESAAADADEAPPATPSRGRVDTQVIPASPTAEPAERAPRRGRGARVASKQPRRQVQLPSLSAQLAVLVVGAVVGLLAVALTFASLQLCELVTGTDSCGGPGLIVLLAVVLLMILGGSAALSAFGVPESGGISFLGVAMFVAICLVVLLPSLLEPWMIVVAPVLCSLSFAVAHWIVTRFDEDILEEDGPPPHDVR